MFQSVSQSQPSARVLIEAAEGISEFNVTLVLCVLQAACL